MGLLTLVARVPETGAFIQWVNGREPQIHKLWCWEIYRIFRKVHPTARVDIPDENVREFFTKYLRKNGRRNHIIGEFLINGSVRFIGLSEIWGSGFPYTPNIMDHFGGAVSPMIPIRAGEEFSLIPQ